MNNSEINEIQVLRNEAQKRSSLATSVLRSARSIRLLIAHKNSTKGTQNAAFIHEMDVREEPAFTVTPHTYGTLEHIRSLKPLLRPDDKTLPKNVREFYENQLELITSIEDVLVPKSEETIDHETICEKKRNRTIKYLTIITLITNIILVIIKIVGAVISKSLSVISSVVDSTVDLLTSIILLWAQWKIKKRDVYRYPVGRTRLEPVAIVILSVIMCSASVQVILESIQTLAQDVEYFKNLRNGTSTTTLPSIEMSAVPITAMTLTIVSKAILFVLCYRIKNPTMYALAEDNRNDVASNIVALICGLLAYNALKKNIQQEIIVLDPIGGIVISVYIIIAWILQASRQIHRLTGISAEPSFLQRLTHIVYNHRPDAVTKIDTVQATHHGTNFFVEVDIGLPSRMPFAMAHDIGEELQNQLESLNDIERAFVHLDFEFSHTRDSEHKIV